MDVKTTETVKYAINGNENGLNITNRKLMSKKAIVDNFIRMCNSDNVTNVFCAVDVKDGRSMIGLTTYGVQTKDSYLNTIAIHENCYAECKDEIAMLNGAVKKAEEKLANKKLEVIRKAVRNGIVLFSTAIVLLAGKIKLDKYFNANLDQVITRTADQDHGTTDAVQEIDNSKDLDSIINMDADQIKQSYENSINEETKTELEELKQNREELGLNPDSVNAPTEETTEYKPSYGYSEIYDNAEKTNAVIDEYNNYETQRQQQELEELRQSYKNEQKVR